MIFRLEYKNRNGLQARLDITTPGSSVVKEIEGTEHPFLLSYKGDKSDKSFNFLTSSAEINIYETPEFNIDALKTSSETQIRVDHYIDDKLNWTGFVIPDFFSREIGGAGVISMTASDRISTLKGVTLSDLPAMVQIRDLAVRCLAKTGLDLPLKTMADFRATELGFNQYFRSEIASQRLYDSKGRSISCYDILKSILVASGSTLRQRGGEWHIINKLQHEAGAGRVYSTENTSVDYVESVHHFDEIVKGARRTIIPVAASVGVYHEYGGGKLYPDNYDFSQGISGWTTYNGFDCEINNKEVLRYIQDLFYWRPSLGDDTGKNNLRCNRNSFNPSANDNPYVESPPIIVTYPDSNSVEVSININAISTGAFIAAVSYINFSVIAKAPDNSLYSLGGAGSFAKFSGNPHFLRERVRAETSGDTTTVFIGAKGVLTVDDDNLEGYNFYVRIYGSGVAFTPFINSVSVSFVNPSDNPKGLIYKREQGVNFTKTHEIDTSIFGDFMTGGFNGYFYPYPIDDTSSIHNPYSGISSLWTTPYFPTETDALPLLQHVVRQQARMFSVAHDLISGEIEIERFDPLSIFVDCNGKRHVIVAASFDFLRSSVKVEIEEIAYANLTVRDFIYSYFGEGESGIKSVGGIASGTGGGGGGGLTPEQLEILSWWKKDPDRENTIFTEMNAYSKKELSAYGAGDGSGGGGGDGIIETVYGYGNLGQTFNNSVLTDTFNAYTINQINTRLVSVESGSATTVNTTGAGNAITSISKAGTVITANKDLTFSLAGHSHPISDVTGLQNALNSKFNNPTGTTAQYIRGDGSLATYTDTTYSSMSLAELNTGTATTSRVVNSKNLNDWLSGKNYYNSRNLAGATVLSNYEAENNEDIRLGGHISNYALSSWLVNRPFSGYGGLIAFRMDPRYGFSGLELAYDIGRNTANGGRLAFRTVAGTGDTVDGAQGGYKPWKEISIEGHTHTFASLTSKPTTLAGYGITDAYTKTEVNSALITKLDKSVFDDLFEKVEVSTGVFAIKAKYNFYGVGEVSAYGIGSGGSGGGIIETVYSYSNLGQSFDNATLTDTFNAYTINQLHTRLSAVESGAALSIVQSGTGNAITSISKAGSVITANKGLTFSLLGHTHTISDIANLQTTLNNKLETSIFSTHNNDNVRHITGAERTKWDGVVTDFGNMEIGGRNLWTNSRTTPATVTIGQYGYSSGTKNISELGLKTGDLITFSVYVSNIPAGESVYARIEFQRPDGTYTSVTNTQYSISNEGVIYVSTFMRDTSEFDRIRYRVTPVNYTANYQVDVVHEKLERGTIPTDWTPAPEDQVSDWNTTDASSFSYIKNKPTQLSQFTDNIGVASHIANTSNPHNVTKVQVGLGNVDNTSDANKPVSTATQNALNLKANLASPTFTGTVTAPTFIGALNGNASTATALQTARTIWGQSFNGEANVSGAMTGVTSLAMTGALSGATTIEASTSVTTPKVIFNAAGWSMEQVGTELQMKHNNILKMRFTSTGSIVATEEITAFG